VLDLPAIEPAARKSENALWTSFWKAQPNILGALLDAVAGALRNYRRIRAQELPRLADFALWATAAEESLGLSEGSVVRAITKNQADASSVPLDASPIIPSLRIVLHGSEGEYNGTATELLRELASNLRSPGGHQDRPPAGWPRSPHALSGILRRLAPNLRSAGVTITFRKTSGAGSQRILMIVDNQGYFSGLNNESEAEKGKRDG
jgi:hypothetical protein